MQRHWDEQELSDRWSLAYDEFELPRNRTERSEPSQLRESIW